MGEGLEYVMLGECADKRGLNRPANARSHIAWFPFLCHLSLVKPPPIFSFFHCPHAPLSAPLWSCHLAFPLPPLCCVSPLQIVATEGLLPEYSLLRINTAR